MVHLVRLLSDGPPAEGLHPAGPRDLTEAAEFLAIQQRGWANGDWLSFVVIERQGHDAPLVGQVAVKPREAGPPVARCGLGEVSYWTAPPARGRGVAPAALRALSLWLFATFGDGVVELMAVHDLGNSASCRTAEKAGYAFRRVSPPNPPVWHTAGHIHTLRGEDCAS